MKKGIILLVLAVLAGLSIAVLANHRIDVESVYADESANAGSTISSHLRIKTGGDNTKIALVIPELGVWSRVGPFDVEEDDSRTISAVIPEDAPKGEYLVRIVVSNDDDRKVRYRFVTIE